MSSDKQIRKTIIAKLTDAQAESVERAVAESGKKRSVYLRDLVGNDCARRGIDWPEDENTHGGNRIRQCPKCDSYKLEPTIGEWECVDCGWTVDYADD